MSLLLLFGGADSGLTLAATPAVVSVVGVTPTLAGTGEATMAASPAIISVVGVTPTLSGTGEAILAFTIAVITVLASAPVITGGEAVRAFGILETLVFRNRWIELQGWGRSRLWRSRWR